MVHASALDSWWAALLGRMPGTAVVAGSSSRQPGRCQWSTGALSGQLVTPSSTFYAASVTKQLVAALVARAVLDGQVEPESTIRRYLPELPGWTAPVQVQHLLHHTAGLPQPRGLAVASGWSDGETGWSRLDNEAVMAALQQLPSPDLQPGRRFSYDNTGYILLAEILRSVHGRGVPDLARSELFGPLGLTGSRLGGPAPVRIADRAPPPATTGDGGLWICLTDLLTWLEAMNEDGLGPDLTALVQSPGRLDDGMVLDYVWGIGPRPGPSGTVYVHGGSWPGWSAMTVRCPATATAVVVLAATDEMTAISTAALELHGLLLPSHDR